MICERSFFEPVDEREAGTHWALGVANERAEVHARRICAGRSRPKAEAPREIISNLHEAPCVTEGGGWRGAVRCSHLTPCGTRPG
ncbi:hypothetical protein SELMODRAFT_437430 [Selaginella moellendorffii]|uniref:Uncharacterized protein n=1 Tax=Selaginella moellendorffii TaxID=88036 RepID=D8QQV5_SELML|nr:hypothetical protein SELMODRAFT_437430 [Selaginella moellendorffii]